MSVFGFGDLAFMGAVGGGERDPFFSNVSLLLHGDGANNSTTIIDSSPRPKTLTPVGDARISTVQSRFGGASLFFDGSGDYLTVPASTDFQFGTGDFTVEFWHYPTSLGGQRGPLQISTTGISTSYASGIMFVNDISVNEASATGMNGGFAANVADTWIGSTNAVLTVNQWHHIALTRESGLVRLFVNNIQNGSAMASANLTGNTLVVGGYYNTSYLFAGHLDDLRITKGVARQITVPTAPFPDA